MKTILITGGMGMIGRNLAVKLKSKGYTVRILSRKKGNGNLYWNPENEEIDPAVFVDLDVIVHLAGAPISKRWTSAYKKELHQSRVDTANLLFENVENKGIQLKKIISASGVNYYGTETSDRTFKEEDQSSDDFLGHLCADWEAAALRFRSVGCQIGILRTAVVLSPDGGMLKKLIPLAKMNLLSALGNGKQIVPWIHIDDLTNMYVYLIENEKIDGVFNAVSPQIVDSDELTNSIAKAMGKKVIFPRVPAFMLKLLFGETSSIMLEGSAVSSEKIQKSGFQFDFPDLDKAMKNLCKK